ncbi:MAG: DHA2 family efflux MFS transporter permease subunit [Syntrophomonas sp.]
MMEENAVNPSTPLKPDWSVITVIIIGVFMAILNGSIVNVALPKIMSIFNATPDSIQWVLTSYMMTLGVLMPISGYLGDTFGYKRMYFMALAIFVFGSLLCACSWSVNSMVAARIVQAVGGSIMQPLGMAFIYRVTPRQQMGLTMGIFGIAAMAAPAIGPTLGGYLVEYVNWRLIFLINVPIGIMNLFLTTILLKETELVKGHLFDHTGLVSSVIGLFCLLLALSQGNKHGWSSAYIISLITIASISLTIFVINELRHPEPILELRLFKNYLFTISTVVGAVINIGMFGAMFLLPLLLQNVLGQTAMKTGIILLPAALATAVMMPVSGKWFDKHGARGVVVPGLILVTWTTYMISRFDLYTSFTVMSAWMVLRGMGMGLCMMPVTTIGMNTIPMHLMGRGSALGNVIRQVAAALGIAMFTSIMQNRQVFHYADMAQLVNMNSNEGLALQPLLYNMAASQGWDISVAQVLGLSLIAKQVTQLSAMKAIQDCFIIASAICLLATVLSFYLRSRNTSPAQEVNEAQM